MARVVLALTTALAVWCAPAARLSGQSQRGVPSHPDDRTVHHVLDRLAFGATPGEIAQIRQSGLDRYIDEQLHPEQLGDERLEARLAELATRTVPSQVADRNRALNELTQVRLLREVLSDRQLNEVLVDFWFNHFNVFAGKGKVREYLAEYETDVIRPHVLGRFRELLGAVAHSPAMLFYLDNWQSAAPNTTLPIPPQLVRRLNDPRTSPSDRAELEARLQQRQMQAKARGLNENYARELLELHTLGVDGGYTQQDVIEVARALTGWSLDRPQQAGGFIFRPQLHDRGEKTILGQRFPAGRDQDEGERVLDLLASHPSTAHHIAFKLAQRFVADNPPPALVDRAAKVFLSSKGDLRAVVREIVTSPEFFAPEAYRAKVKTPLEFVVSAVRSSGAAVMNAQSLAQALRSELGMPLFGCQPPTGYANTADAWVNTGALLNRMNFALRLVNGESRGIRVDLNALVPDVSPTTRERLVDVLLSGNVSTGTATALAKAETPAQLLALTLGSPEFQRR